MLNVGSGHVALVESTGTSVSQADGFLCGTQGEKRHVTASCSGAAAQTHRPGTTKSSLASQICRWKKKKSRKAVALEEHLSHSSILSPHYPAF